MSCFEGLPFFVRTVPESLVLPEHLKHSFSINEDLKNASLNKAKQCFKQNNLRSVVGGKLNFLSED
jgi:hypothetical protein